MVRVMKCFGLALAMCLVAAQLAPAAAITVKVGVTKTEKTDAGKPIVTVFTLDGPILDKPKGEEMPLLAPVARPSLKDLVERMRKAKDDKDVKGVVLLLDEVDLGLAQIEELRQAMDSVRAAGKEVYVHVDNLLTMRGLRWPPGPRASASLPRRLSCSPASTPSRPTCGACWTRSA